MGRGSVGNFVPTCMQFITIGFMHNPPDRAFMRPNATTAPPHAAWPIHLGRVLGGGRDRGHSRIGPRIRLASWISFTMTCGR